MNGKGSRQRTWGERFRERWERIFEADKKKRKEKRKNEGDSKQ